MHAIGIDLSGSNIKAALVHRAFGMGASVSVDACADGGPERVLDQIEIAAQLLLKRTGKVLGIGIGAPGTIDIDRTTLIHPPNLPGWEILNLREALQKRLGKKKLPVFVENDANAAALGSAGYGAGKQFDNFLMVTLGTGVGGAIVIDKKVFRGTTGAAGELGHMSIDFDGPQDMTGVKGAVEAYLGYKFLVGHARELLTKYPGSTLHAAPGLAHLTPATIAGAAMAGDKGAQEILRWGGHKLGCALGSCVNLLDIRTIVVGGGVSAAGDLILDAAREAINAYIKPGMRESVVVLQETLGNEACMLGAASLVFEHVGKGRRRR